MTKPWDNEPTPTTDSKDHRNGIIAYQYARSLERRLRHAEKLLESARNQIDSIGIHIPMDADTWDGICEHLKAARQEDGR